MIRDLGHIVKRENAQIGVLVTMNEPTLVFTARR
jgi:hypothetical protein